ncbi:MAG: glutamate 5-kinase [Fibrobacterota bacterium]|nr:glutamate 5-kinase [Fibrobacterota bacterium]QQS05748.1 MAG: glutamate 5-kinase [Fibrobacterota bacterium]
MSANLRQELLSKAHRVVVKVGTRLLTHEQGGLAPDQLERVVDQIVALRGSGREVVLVTSGAVGIGMGILGHASKPKQLAEKQACAAVGQIRLMHAYDESFARRGVTVAQYLLTAEDFRDPERFSNIRATTDALLRHGVVPIVNENDVVATSEIKVGDNDRLSADVCHFLEADLLVILSDIDGLFTANPKSDPEASLIPIVHRVTPEIESLAGGAGSLASTGGMITKIVAARTVTESGSACVIANGFTSDLVAIASGAPQGTLFLPSENKLGSRKRWIRFVSTPKGRLVLDAGAVQAVVERRTSLLAKGVASVEGSFPAGVVVEMTTGEGHPIARGVANFSAADMARIAGRNSAEIPGILGHSAPQEAIHRDNLFVL